MYRVASGRDWDDALMARQKPLGVSPEVGMIVMDRAGYRCERCGSSDHPQGFSKHHRLPRRMGGSRNPSLHKPANLIFLCGSGTSGCHGWVESHREEAREIGYLLYEIENAEEVDFTDTAGVVWKITNDGLKVRVATQVDNG